MILQSPRRRSTDKNIMKRLFDTYASYFHVIAFLIMCIFTVGLYFEKFQAHSEMIENHSIRLTALEAGQNKISQQLQDMIDYWRIPHKNRY